ncbi:MAG TPA: rhodanese-like domain-containing protein [Ktedonobacterales bacterium]|jgi:glyoxylase-like metal-dependent hydrolase (beta-lactamase superfamily II)/rhodanese-related sulfurtransferase
MYFQQFLDQLHGCASYLIASRERHEAAVVDPSMQIEQYEDLLRSRDFTLKYVVDTHVHADHISGARKLAEAYDATLCLHESARVKYPFHPLHEGDELALGQTRLRVAQTPGHRPELISLLIMDLERSAEPEMVLTGDSLLVGDVGRPDFGGGDATQQYESIARLLALPDWVAVFPGHFEGPCGKSMAGNPSTTIGFERLFNPLAQLEREAFIEELTRNVPSRPLNMLAIEPTNRGLEDFSWAMLTTTPEITNVDVETLAARKDEAFVLDVREPDEYQRGHVSGANNIPQAELASRLDELPREQPILVICRTGSRSRHATEFLTQIGYTDVANVLGGTSAWRRAGKPLVREENASSTRS